MKKKRGFIKGIEAGDWIEVGGLLINEWGLLVNEWVLRGLSGGGLRMLLYHSGHLRDYCWFHHSRVVMDVGKGLMDMSVRMYYIYFKELLDKGVIIRMDGAGVVLDDARMSVMDGSYMFNPDVLFVNAADGLDAMKSFKELFSDRRVVFDGYVNDRVVVNGNEEGGEV